MTALPPRRHVLHPVRDVHLVSLSAASGAAATIVDLLHRRRGTVPRDQRLDVEVGRARAGRADQPDVEAVALQVAERADAGRLVAADRAGVAGHGGRVA